MRGRFSIEGDRTATRASFVERLRDWRDETTWGQFLSRYGKLVHRVALRAGLREDEADEVVQETALAVARKMPEFEYRPGQCSFEGWVRRMARLRIMDQLRRRGREARVGHVDGVGCVTARGGDPGSGTGEERSWMAEPCVTPDDDAAWMEAWKEMLLGRALERVRLAATPEHYQIFFMTVMEDRPGADVARILDVSLAQVYVVRHRLMGRLQREVEKVRKEAECGLDPGLAGESGKVRGTDGPGAE